MRKAGRAQRPSGISTASERGDRWKLLSARCRSGDSLTRSGMAETTKRPLISRARDTAIRLARGPRPERRPSAGTTRRFLTSIWTSRTSSWPATRLSSGSHSAAPTREDTWAGPRRDVRWRNGRSRSCNSRATRSSGNGSEETKLGLFIQLGVVSDPWPHQDAPSSERWEADRLPERDAGSVQIDG